MEFEEAVKDVTDIDTKTEDSGSIIDKKNEETGLLFLGTFYHENNNEHNVDLIQFKEAVRIQEIRVIPLGATVNLSNGSYQLGATNPSELELEFYYNNLKNPSQSTFSVLNNFKYQEKIAINFRCDSEDQEILTDGLLVRGLYSSITLASYGYQIDKDTIQVVQENIEVSDNMEVDTTMEKSTISDESANDSKHQLQLVLTDDDLEEKEAENEGGQDLSNVSNEAEQKEEITINTEEEVPQQIPTITTRVNLSPVKLLQQEDICLPMLLDEEKVERVSSEEEHFDEIQDKEQKANRGNPNLLEPDAEDISDEEILCEPKEDGDYVGNNKKGDFTFPGDIDNVSKDVEDKELSNIDSGQEFLSDHEDSFGEDFSDYVEQISDAELDEYEDADYWDDLLIEKASYETDPFSSAFEVIPLKNLTLDSYIKKNAKYDQLLAKQVTQTLKRYSEYNFSEHFIESWVEALEQTLPILPVALPFLEQEDPECIHTLGVWVKLGLDLDAVKKHSTPPMIVRHLKSGLKLTFILCFFGGPFLDLVKQMGSLNWTLIDVLKDEVLSTSIVQRLVCKIFNSTLNSLKGWEEFTTPSARGLCIDELLTFFQQNVEPRCSFVIKSLQAKLILMNHCFVLKGTAMDVIDKKPVSCSSWKQLELGLDELKFYTTEYLNYERSSNTVIEEMADPLTGLDTRIGFFCMLHDFKFMASLAVVLHCHESNFGNQTLLSIWEAIRDIQSLEAGLIYLNSEAEATKVVLRKLKRVFDKQDTLLSATIDKLCLELQVIKDMDNLMDDPRATEAKLEDNNSFRRLNSLVLNGTGQEALTSVLCLGNQVHTLLDILAEKQSGVTESTRISSLCRKGYVVPLLCIVVSTCDNLEFLQSKGPVIHEVVSSIKEDFEGSDRLNGLLPFLKPTLDSANFSLDGVEKLCHLLERKVEEDFLSAPLIRRRDKYFGFTPEVITILRMLSGLTEVDLRPKTIIRQDEEESSKRLKSMECYVEMNSKDLLTVLIKIIRKIMTEFQDQGFPTLYLTGSKGDLLAFTLQPTLKLMRIILSEVIETRKSEYRNLEPVEALIQVYGLLKSYPRTSNSWEKVAETSFVVVDIIGLCAVALCNVKSDEESEEQLKSCMWTRTIAAILQFTLSTPSHVKAGLDLLLSIMPNASSLQAKSKVADTKEESIRLNYRRWGVYMHGVTEEVQELIGTYCISNDFELLKKLVLFCSRLANLSASTCLMVCRIVMDKIMLAIENDSENNKNSNASLSTVSINAWVQTITDRRLIVCSLETMNSLRFLKVLVNMNSRIKTGIMYVGRASSKLDEKYAPFIGLLCNILASFHGDPESDTAYLHLQGQTFVMSIFQSLCDIDNNMFNNKIMDEDSKGTIAKEQMLSNSLPIKENFGFICSALLSFLQYEKLRLPESQTALNTLFSTLSVLAGTDYGFHHIKISLLNQSSHIGEFLSKLADDISSARTRDDVAVKTSYLFVKFVYSLIQKPQKIYGPWELVRQNTLSSFEVQKCFTWGMDDLNSEDKSNNLLLEVFLKSLEKLTTGSFVDCINLDYCKSVRQLQDILEYVRQDENECILKTEVVLPPPDTFKEVFAMQPIISATTEDLNQAEIDCGFQDGFSKESPEPNYVSLNLSELYQNAFKTDLMAELGSVYKIKNLYDPNGTRHSGQGESKPVDNTSFKSPADALITPTRKPITYHTTTRASARGVFGRGHGGSGSRGVSHFDPFRSRPPNTSRPPSLHVDDFVALESSTGSSTSSRTGGRGTGTQEQFFSRGRGGRGSMGRTYDSERGRPFRQQGQMNSLYYSRNDQSLRGRGSRGRGWQTNSESRSSPSRGSYTGRNMNYQSVDEYRSNQSNLSMQRTGGISTPSSMRNSPAARYLRPYREAPPSDKTSSCLRDKLRYNR